MIPPKINKIFPGLGRTGFGHQLVGWSGSTSASPFWGTRSLETHFAVFQHREVCVSPKNDPFNSQKEHTQTFWDTHAIEKNWIIGVIRQELNPKTCN